MAWAITNMPPQIGRVALVTGTGGLGFEVAKALAGAGAHVLLAGRSADRGRASVAAILAAHPDATIAFEMLDLADLRSVRACGERLSERHQTLDILVNNAGVMAPPRRNLTSDGSELQFGTNYLGHFALTAYLLPLLRRGRDVRVVGQSSLAHHGAAIYFDDPAFQRRYSPWQAYGQSKLAVLMFALELQRRSDAAGWGLESMAVHPGFARTALIANGPGENVILSTASRVLRPVGQSAAAGALPTLFAATSREAVGGGYYGPDGVMEVRGDVAPARIARQARNADAARRLWSLSERLTGASFEALEPA